MLTFNKPDLNAPRFRPKRQGIVDKEFYNKFVSAYPRYNHLTLADIKALISDMNGIIWGHVIEQRDGVELPEQLGNIFIGSCPRKKGPNPDFAKSHYYGTLVQNRNWESDGFVAKILYTNYETKYRFKHNTLWGFEGVRDFTRGVAHSYPENWKRYRTVDSFTPISRLFRKQATAKMLDTLNDKSFQDYDEFYFD